MRILCCGMYRAGSTWQYNAIRFMHPNYKAGAAAYMSATKFLAAMKEKNVIFKVHDYFDILVEWADVIVTSYRSPYEVLASSRKFGPEHPNHVELVRRHYDYHLTYRPHADYNMNYVNLLNSPKLVIGDLGKLFGVDVNLDEIAKKLNELSYNGPDYDPVTLLHKGHRTGSQPSSDDRALIVENFNDILQIYHYPVV